MDNLVENILSIKINHRRLFMGSVVPLKKYCLEEGITTEAVKKRVREGIWQMGREVIKVKGFRGLFIDTDATDRYLRDPKNHER